MAVVAPTAASAYSQGDFSGSLMRGRAYGASGSVTNGSATVTVGSVALQSLGCNPALDDSDAKDAESFHSSLNVLGSISIPLPNSHLLVQSDTIRDTGVPSAGPGSAEVKERSVIQQVNLLEGVITATAVQADAHTRLDATGWNSFTTADEYRDDSRNDGSTGTIVTDLQINNGGTVIDVPPNPAPNTTYTLTGIGKLVVNEQIPAGTKYKDPLDPKHKRKVHSGIDVNALHLYIGTPSGSFLGFTGDIIVGHAETRLSVASGRLSGFAYGTRGTVDPFLKSGPQAVVSLPCTGGPKSFSQAAVNVKAPSGAPLPVLVSSGTLDGTVDGAFTTDSAGSVSGAYSHSTENIEGLKLLADSTGKAWVSADVLHAEALTQTVPGGIGSSGDGSYVTNLSVDLDGPDGAQPPIVLNGAVPPNTTFDLLGVGTLTVNEQSCKDGASDDTSKYTAACSSTAATGVDTHYESITVRMIHLHITDASNGGKLPVGADVYVDVAHSDVSF